MEREILFRGKIKDNEWLYGYYMYNNKHLIVDITKGSLGFGKEVIPETVGQFTGLFDSSKWEELSKKQQKEFLSHPNKDGKPNTKEDWKGKRIFEGDIVKNDFGYIGLIVFKACSYYIEWVSGNFTNDLYVMADGVAIIGNIHDNPELLGE